MNKNSFAEMPPMGWNSYDYYDTTVTEADILENAEYMAKNLSRYGYEYVVVDIQWYAKDAGSRRSEYQYIPFGEVCMDEFGRLVPDETRFPSSAGGAGFGPLAEKIHEMGLKFGIHIMRGIPREAAHRHLPILNSDLPASEVADPSSICRWNPDMYGVKDTPEGQAYYDSIVSMYASWGVDFIKCDDICNVNNTSPTEENAFSRAHEIIMLHEAIMKTGRPIVFSLSPGPALIKYSYFYEKYANMWRITDDFWDEWPLLKNMFERCEQWKDHVDVGCYPDCDMLPVGNLGKGFGKKWKSRFTISEIRTMMVLWCMFGSPLMIGAHLPTLDMGTKTLLTNTDVLSMRSPNLRPKEFYRTEDEAVWYCRDEEENRYYVAIFNISDSVRAVVCDLTDVIGKSLPVRIKNIWTKEVVTTSNLVIHRTIEPHDVCLLEF
ncbi:MAG: glycoside hydrolase family 27 protein [Lachnospiraceae bacterium]|nr:glycoside hydrolase family 27 protein [Lachnospiraceae bacterium]